MADNVRMTNQALIPSLIMLRYEAGPRYGSSTTHMACLRARTDRGRAGARTVVISGIRGTADVED